MISKEQVIQLLRQYQQDNSLTQAGLAKAIGVRPQYVCDIYRHRRSPGPAILKFLGLKKVEVYEI